MRRILVVVSVVVLAVWGAAGGAAAGSGEVHSVSLPDVALSEVKYDQAVDFVELRNLTGSSFSLENFELVQCTPTGPVGVFAFGMADSIPAGDVVVVASALQIPEPGGMEEQADFVETTFAMTDSDGLKLIEVMAGGERVEDRMSYNPALTADGCASGDPNDAGAPSIPTTTTFESTNRILFTGVDSVDWATALQNPGV